MVSRVGVIAIFATLFSEIALSGFVRIDGPRFFNATKHEIGLQVTFTGGGEAPVSMPAGSHFTFPDELQVVSVQIKEKGVVRSRYAGATLPRVPDDLVKPYRQLWVIEEDRICVLSERLLHRDAPLKC